MLFKAILTKVSRSICLSGYSSTRPFPFLSGRLEPFSFLSIVFNLSRLLLSLSKCTTELDPPTSSGGLLLCPSLNRTKNYFNSTRFILLFLIVWTNAIGTSSKGSHFIVVKRLSPLDVVNEHRKLGMIHLEARVFKWLKQIVISFYKSVFLTLIVIHTVVTVSFKPDATVLSLPACLALT